MCDMEIWCAVFGLVFNSFFLQIVVGSLMFARGYRRKRSLRSLFLILCAFLGLTSVMMAIIFGFEIPWEQQLLYYIICCGCSYLYLRITFYESWEEVLMCMVSGYLSQHIASQFAQSILVNKIPTMKFVATKELLLFSVLEFFIFAIVYLIIYYVFGRRNHRLPEGDEIRNSIIGLSAIAFLLVIFLSGVRDHFAYESLVLAVISRIFSVFCCLFIFVLRYYIIERQEQETEKRLLRQMSEMQMRQFKLSQETIELINLKCHDMRHQIQLWENRGGADKRELEEIKNLISIYDTSVKTGNDVLDTILTEKSIFCEHNGIRLTCIMDGSCLSFMKESDICTLFGNALENAIEAVEKIENLEERIISMHLKVKKDMMIFTCENYYNGQLELKNGILKTSKNDEDYHGFGLRSIRRVATSYGGEATVDLDELFRLSVIIPLAKKSI